MGARHGGSDTPLFITSTTFARKDYGVCADHFKERLGLETASRQDLFVLRNVVRVVSQRLVAGR